MQANWFQSPPSSVPKQTAVVADFYPMLEGLYDEFKKSRNQSAAFKLPDLETTIVMGEWMRFVFDARERATGLRDLRGDHFVVISSDDDNLTAGIKFDEIIFSTGYLGGAWNERLPRASLLKHTGSAGKGLLRSMFISDIGVAYYFLMLPAAALTAQSGALWNAIFASDFSLGDAAGSVYPSLSEDLFYVEPFPSGQGFKHGLSQTATSLSEKLDVSAEFRADYLASLKASEPQLRDEFFPDKTRFDVCKRIRDSLYQQYFLTLDAESSSGGRLQGSIAALNRVIDWIAPSFENQVAWQRHAKQAQNFMRLRNLHARSHNLEAALGAREQSLFHLANVPVRLPSDQAFIGEPINSGTHLPSILQPALQPSPLFSQLEPQSLSLGAYFQALHPGALALQIF